MFAVSDLQPAHWLQVNIIRQQHLSQILYADDSNGRFPFKDNISPEYRRIPITGTRSIVNRLRDLPERNPDFHMPNHAQAAVGRPSNAIQAGRSGERQPHSAPKSPDPPLQFLRRFCNMYDGTRPARSHHVSHQQCLQVYYRVTEGVSDRALLENAACTYAHQRRFLECWLRSHW